MALLRLPPSSVSEGVQAGCMDGGGSGGEETPPLIGMHGCEGCEGCMSWPLLPSFNCASLVGLGCPSERTGEERKQPTVSAQDNGPPARGPSPAAGGAGGLAPTALPGASLPAYLMERESKKSWSLA